MKQQSFIQVAVAEFRRMKRMAEMAMDQVDDEHFFERLGSEDNGIAVIVKHMAGNLRSRWLDFLTTDGEKPDRDRDAEFETFDGDTRASLMESWDTGWQILFDALRPLDDGDLQRAVTIRGEALSVMQAVCRQLTHYSYHVGQLVLTARHFAGENWKTLSIAKGGTAAFNANPAKYVRDDNG
jgi:hypothetical protein